MGVDIKFKKERCARCRRVLANDEVRHLSFTHSVSVTNSTNIETERAYGPHTLCVDCIRWVEDKIVKVQMEAVALISKIDRELREGMVK